MIKGLKELGDMRLKVAATQQYARDVKFYDTVQKAVKVVEAGGASEEKVKLSKLANFMEEPVKPEEVDIKTFEALAASVSEEAKKSVQDSAASVAAMRILQDNTLKANYEERLKALGNLKPGVVVNDLVAEAKQALAG